MEFILQKLAGLLEGERAGVLVRVLFLLLVGLPLVRLGVWSLRKLTGKHLSSQATMIFSKAVGYTGTILILLMCMREMGFKLNALLGAAGIAGVAIGFASQTSLSNLISGLFLIWERPFQVGDVVTVGDVTGMVLSIDLLSVKIRKFDNCYVRIPNENVIKSQTTNITRFAIRRMDIVVGVAYKENIRRVMEVLREIADANPLCLDEPEPFVLFRKFGDSALEILFGVWFEKTDYRDLMNSIMVEIKERFDREGIEIPFPHRTLYVRQDAGPFSVSGSSRISVPESGGENPPSEDSP